MADAPRITLLDGDKITVWCYPSLQLVHHEIHAYCYGEPFRAALQAGLQAMIEHRATRWLSDDRNNGPLSPDDEEWATKTWFPQVKAAGWKRWAMVKPALAAGQMNVSRFVAMYAELGIIARLFTEPVGAFEWVCSDRE